MSKAYDAIVIGSGLGGLSAGALFARTGAKVLLLEKNETFGGAATTYRRGDLVVEAALHETTHPQAPGDQKRALFDALDLEEKLTLIPVETFQEVRSRLIGAPLALPHGFEAVEGVLAARFPDQKRNLGRFFRQLRRTQRFAEFASDHRGVLWRAANAIDLPLELWAVVRDMRSTLSDVLERYFGDDEAVKIALAANLPYWDDDPDAFWWLGYAFAQGEFLGSGGYFIKGGSQRLSDALVEILAEEGAETVADAHVVAIELGVDGEARGVRYRRAGEDRETFAYAPTIFANAAPTVIETLLPFDRREAFMAPFDHREPSISLFSATFGLDVEPSRLGVANYSTVLVPDWIKRLADYKHSAALLGDAPDARMPLLCVVDYGQIDSGLTKAAPYPVNVVCPDRLENWASLDDAAYRARKDAWLDAIATRLDAEWPGFAAAVVDRVLTTPRSLHERLGTTEGSVYGFAVRPPETRGAPPMRVETAIDGLWLASSYAGFGGFTGSLTAGAAAARAALRARSAPSAAG